jgi:ABC-type phosphate transport system substrate-binding protein
MVPILGCATLALTAASPAATTVHGFAPASQKLPIARAFYKRGFAGSGGTLYGGGATLPAAAYLGPQAFSCDPGTIPDVCSGTTANGSILYQLLAKTGPDSGDSAQYCQTGSGYGRNVIENAGDPPNGPCAALGASPTGFGIPSSAQTYADFAGSDVPDSQSDVNNQATHNSSRGELVQTPYIAGSVALLYKNSSLANAAQLELSVETICAIANGQIINWNQVPKNPAKPSGPFFPGKPLTLVYRYDGSGTMFSFGNYVSATNPSNPNQNSHCQGQTFGLSQVYDPFNNSKGSSGGYGVYQGTSEPNNFLAGNLNPGVVACILNSPGAQCYHADTQVSPPSDGAIGIVEAANALSAVNNAAGINYAQIAVKTGKKLTIYDPIKNLPTAASGVTALSVNEVLQSPLASGRPNPDITAASGVTGNCLGIVDPASYDNVKSGYPIIGVTNLEFTSVGNGAKAPDLQNLATFVDQTNFKKSHVTTIDPVGAKTGTTGYSAIALPAKAIAAIASCIGA